MRHFRESSGVVTALCITLFACTTASQDLDVVISGGRVIDPASALNAVRDIGIRGNTIVEISERSLIADLRDDGTSIDATGLFVVPGFIDTHAHFRGTTGSHAEFLNTLLAFGITTFRDPSSRPVGGVALRERIRSGELLGPEMLTAGTAIDGPTEAQIPTVGDLEKFSTEVAVRAEVRRQAAQGVDYVKLYMWLSPDLVAAATDEAHRHGLGAIGHLNTTSWTDAARSGIDVLVHSGAEGPVWELLGEEDQARFATTDWAENFKQWTMTAQRIDLTGPQMQELVGALIANEVEVNPTLVVMETHSWGDDTSVLARLEPQYAPQALIEASWYRGGITDWRAGNPFMMNFDFSRDDFARAKEAFGVAKAMVRIFHESGVLITAGSDVAMPWITPGVSFHRELELLVESGIPVADVLTIATANGAKALNLSEKTGTVEEGKDADLVLLRANPLEDISNTRSIEHVVLDGQVLNPSELLDE